MSTIQHHPQQEPPGPPARMARITQPALERLLQHGAVVLSQTKCPWTGETLYFLLLGSTLPQLTVRAVHAALPDGMAVLHTVVRTEDEPPYPNETEADPVTLMAWTPCPVCAAPIDPDWPGNTPNTRRCISGHDVPVATDQSQPDLL